MLCCLGRQPIPTLETVARPGNASMRHLLSLPSPDAEARAVAAANAAGVGLGGLVADGYYESGAAAGLVVSYGAAPENTFRGAVDTLASVLTDIDV
jgi:DNA-binding transcriptional MocR family regulator